MIRFIILLTIACSSLSAQSIDTAKVIDKYEARLERRESARTSTLWMAGATVASYGLTYAVRPPGYLRDVQLFWIRFYGIGFTSVATLNLAIAEYRVAAYKKRHKDIIK